MKQHLKTKVLDDKALRLSATSCQHEILYLSVIPPVLKFHMPTVNPLFLQLYTFDWRNIAQHIAY